MSGFSSKRQIAVRWKEWCNPLLYTKYFIILFWLIYHKFFEECILHGNLILIHVLIKKNIMSMLMRKWSIPLWGAMYHSLSDCIMLFYYVSFRCVLGDVIQCDKMSFSLIPLVRMIFCKRKVAIHKFHCQAHLTPLPLWKKEPKCFTFA